MLFEYFLKHLSNKKGYYSSGTTAECQHCAFPCANCTDAVTCTACVLSTAPRSGTSCACPDGINSHSDIYLFKYENNLNTKLRLLQ
jgi:hypothetical protein